MSTETKKQLAAAETELAAAQTEKARLEARLEQLSLERHDTEQTINALAAARKTALRKAGIEGTAVAVDRNELSQSQFHLDEIREMEEAIHGAIADIEKDLPRLTNNLGTARRAFMAEQTTERIHRLFGDVNRGDLIEILVLNMGASAGGRAATFGELVEVLRNPTPDEITAAASRVKELIGFAPY